MRFAHFISGINFNSEPVISQYPELLIIYIKTIILDLSNFDAEEHPSNIKVANLNIIKLRMGNAPNVANQIYQI